MGRRVPENVPKGKAVSPMRKAEENLATVDTVAVDEMEQEIDEKLQDETGDEVDGDDEEAQQPKVIRSPKAPTKAE